MCSVWQLCVLVIICLVSSCLCAQLTTQTCTTVTQTTTACFQTTSSATLKLTCPPKYTMLLHTAQYLVAGSPTCPQQHAPTHCRVTDKVDEVWFGCEWQNSCDVTVSRLDAGLCGTNGAHYVAVTYDCNSGNPSQGELSKLMSTDDIHFAYVYSKIGHDMTAALFTDTSRQCILTVPSNVQVSFKIRSFTKKPDRGGCSQHIRIVEEGEGAHVLCGTETEPTLAACRATSTTFNMQYVNDDPTVKVAFLIEVKVSHNTAGFSMACGLELRLPQTTPPPPLTRGTTDTNPQEGVKLEHDSTSLTLILIIVSVIVFIIIAGVIIAYVLKRFSNDKVIIVNEDGESSIGAKRTLPFSRPMYLDGSTRVNLVVENRRSHMCIDGALGLGRY